MSAAKDSELAARLADAVARHGRWTAHNIVLGDGVFTMGADAVGTGEARIQQVVQVVQDASARPIEDLRILDLGCYEGGFAIEFAARGAEVVAIDARQPHIEKVRFAREALGLQQLTAEVGDVRSLDPADIGTFDVVLCLGILYHLDAPDCFRLLEAVAALTRSFAVIETQVALRGQRRESYRARAYEGRTYPEDTQWAGASVKNRQSYWLTERSLLNLTADVGFSSCMQVRMPVVPNLVAYRDHITLVAFAGRAVELVANRQPAEPAARWPQRLPVLAHPAQGPLYRLKDGLRRRRGGGIRGIFGKRRAGR